MTARWMTYDSCLKRGEDIALTWSGVESSGYARSTRIDPIEMDCPNRCGWTSGELGKAYRGRPGM